LSGQRIRIGYAQLRGIPYESETTNNTIFGHAERGTLTREILDQLTAHWLIHDNIDKDELATLKSFLVRYNRLTKRYRPGVPPLKLITRIEFIKNVFFKKSFALWSKKIRNARMAVGHNLPFDIGACETDTVKSREKHMVGSR
jgi:hypothetical protein